jgi:transcriptional regulator with GAF, ATPase, and Fis domain/pSer/pThr/pTyr-binding forkhead associated (FHA) protein
MIPKLLAISGPLKGSEFPLHSGEFAIGREPSNAIWLEHSSVSRRHCAVRVQEGRYTISDIESRNGTFVNNVPVKERELENGDEVRIGEYVFLFLTRESIAVAGPPAVIDESKLLTRSIVLKPEDSRYLSPARLASELGEEAAGRTAQIARDLNALLSASEAIHSLRGTAAIAHQLLQSAFEVTRAQRGAVVLFDAEGTDENAAFGWDREAGAVADPNYQALIDRVKEELATVSCDDLIGAPLVAFERMLGAIALESDGATEGFDENHLQLVAALGAIAGPALQNSRRLELVESENQRLHAEIGFHHNMVGESAPMRAVFHMIGKAAPSDATVLIRGESGSGKELIARAIHAASRRSGKAFVAINCATLSETLMESELFGHERGAFTGAVAQKRGKLELADGGTLFLDEVGELAPVLQAKLLRVLQEREFERVGGVRPIRVDIRLIAATNRDVEQAVESGSFRRDLYYRLNVISHTAPPLRERREDIPLLANYFVARYVEKTGRRIAGISPQARAYLMRHDWPGNVRELENAIERAVVLGSSELIEPEDLPESVLETASGGGVIASGYHEALIEEKKRLILGAIEQARGSHLEAAKLLGLNPTYLSRLIRSLNLKAVVTLAGQR